MSAKRGNKLYVAYGYNNINSENIPIHFLAWNKEETIRKWTSLSRKKTQTFRPTRHTVLYSAHFTEETFLIEYRFEEEFGGKKKRLNRKTFPTIDSLTDMKERTHRAQDVK